MRMPFTADQFLALFRDYHANIGLAPAVLALLGVGIAALAFTRYPWRHHAIAGGLAVLWLWAGVVYHWTFFMRINPAAWVFGALFVLQASLLVAYGVLSRGMRFVPHHVSATVAGVALVAYALVVYPLLGLALGHGYPVGPSFGAPCPTTIFFFGMILLAVDTVPIAVLVLPMFWALAGTSAAVQLGMREDFGLAVAALVVLFEIVRHRHARAHERPPRAPRRPVTLHRMR